VVNPYFIGLHEHIVKYLLDPYLYEHITEFMAFNFGHPAAKYIETLMLLGAATAFWNLYNRRFEYFVLLAGWLHLGLNVRRNIPLFSIICAPFIAEALFCWLRELQSLRTVEWIKSVGRRFEDTAAGIGETDRLPPAWAQDLHSVDRIWAPSACRRTSPPHRVTAVPIS